MSLAQFGIWDAVVDTSGYTPVTVELAAEVLSPVVGGYVYISTVNAYQGWPIEPLTEDSPLHGEAKPGPDLSLLERYGVDVEYGQLKAACERELRAAFSHPILVLRPGVILGPYEYIGRLPWLLRRMEHGGQVLAAGSPSRAIQPVDVRDIALFILHAVEHGISGTMNTTAPFGRSTYGELLGSCREVTGGAAQLVWVEDDWLSAQDVTTWSEIPLWRPTAGAWRVAGDKAAAAGLTCRPLPETVRDTWRWLQTENPVPHQRAAKIGLSTAKEEQLLAAWFDHCGGQRGLRG